MRRTLFVAVGALAVAGVAGRLAFAHDARTSRTSRPAHAVAQVGFSERAVRDTQIMVWQQALAADSASAIALGQLAALHLQRAREGGSWSDYLESERLARASLGHRTGRNGKTAVTLVSSLLAQHRFTDARRVATDLVGREPDVAQYRSLLGEVAMELGDYATAGRLLDSLWSERGTLSVASRLARWAELTGHVASARELLTAARDDAMRRGDVPNETKAWFQFRVGDLALRSGRPRAAEAAFRAGLAIEPDDPRLLAGMARLFAIRDDPAEAIAWGDRAIAAQLDPATLGLVGDAYAAIGDRAKAGEYFRTMEVAVSAQPGQYHRAWGLYLLDHAQRVDEVLDQAHAALRERRDVYGYDLYAWALHAAHRDAEAAAAMRRALALDTPDATLWYHDGMIARALGDAARARVSLGRALTINPYFHPQQAGAARAVLDSLARGN